MNPFWRNSFICLLPSAAIFQLGIIKVLFENFLLPKVICGSSAGALVAALVCCRTDEELPGLFEKDALDFGAFKKRDEKGRFRRRLNRLFRHGVLMDIKIVEQALYDNIGNITFQEAYAKTGRLLNITLSTSGGLGTPRLLNYLNAPNVLIWTAACASCSVVGLYEEVEILEKTSRGDIQRWNTEGVTWAGLPQEGYACHFSFFSDQMLKHSFHFDCKKHANHASVRTVLCESLHCVQGPAL